MATIKQFKLPDVGEGLTEGEILQWLVAVGDTVRVNQPIVEVETAKAAVELPCPYAGVVVELMYEPGTTVDVGAPIISIETDPDGAAGPPATAVEREAAAAEAPEPSAETLAEVHVAGDEEAIEPGLIGGPAPGGRTSILVGYGPRTVEAKRRPRVAPPAPDAAQAGTAQPESTQPDAAQPESTQPESPPILATAPDATAKPVRHGGLEMGRAAETAAARAEPSTGADRAARTQSTGAEPSVRAHPSTALAKPPVRKYAKDLGVDLATVTGSGPQGSVTRADVEAAATDTGTAAADVEPAGQPDAVPAPSDAEAHGRETRIPIKGVRKHTAAAMVASAFTAPHVTEWVSIDVTPMLKLRSRLAERPDFRDVKISPLAFVAKALCIAAARHPMINSSWDEAAQEIVVKDYVNLGIAAATPRGLIVPNIKDAGRLSLRELAQELVTLTETARAGKTAPAEMAGGTITITNVGVFGVDTGTPILNPGESAILAFGAIRQLPWVHRGKVRPRSVTQLGLSFDHRVVDGELGSRFLADVGSLLADPGLAIAW